MFLQKANELNNKINEVIPGGPKPPLFSPRLILRDFVQEDIPSVISIASHN